MFSRVNSFGPAARNDVSSNDFVRTSSDRTSATKKETGRRPASTLLKPQRNAKMSAGTRSAQTCTAIESWEADEIASCQILLDEAITLWKQCVLALGPKPHYRDSSQASREYLEATKLVRAAKHQLSSLRQDQAKKLPRLIMPDIMCSMSKNMTLPSSSQEHPEASVKFGSQVNIEPEELMKARRSEWKASFTPDIPPKKKRGVPSFTGSS